MSCDAMQPQPLISIQ